MPHAAQQSKLRLAGLGHGDFRLERIRLGGKSAGGGIADGGGDGVGGGGSQDAVPGSFAGGRDQSGGRALAQAQTRGAAHGGAGRRVLFELLANPAGAAGEAGNVFADISHHRSPQLQREHVVERRDPVDFGGRHVEAPGDVIDRPRADPADAPLDGMQGGQEPVAAGAEMPAADRDAALECDTPLAAFPAGLGLSQLLIDGSPFVFGGLIAGEMNVQLILLWIGSVEVAGRSRLRRGQRVDANGGGLEFRGSGLGVDGIDGEIVGGHLLVKMDGQEGQPGAQTGVDANWSHHRSAAGRTRTRSPSRTR